MAKKKFHLTPSGVRECKAGHVSKCPYRGNSPHFDTEAEALIVQKQIEDRRERIKRNTTLQRKLDQRDPNDVYATYIDFNYPDAIRRFGEDVEKYPADPIGYEVHTNVTLDNGAFSPVEMTLRRKNVVNDQTGEIEGQWILETVIEQDEENYFSKTEEETVLHFDETNARETWSKLHRAVRKNVYRSGVDTLYNEDEVDLHTDWHSYHFKQMIDSVETEALGSFRAWEKGVGYFTESEPDLIRVDTSFSESAFTGKHFRDFLAENPLYSNSTPAVDIRISEHEDDGSGWELNMADGYWWIRLQDSDGRTVEEEILEPNETYSRMYMASRDTLGRHTSETERHAEYAAEVVREVNAALQEHPARIQEYWEQEKAFRASRDKNFVHEVLNEPADRESTIDKIFGLFR